MTLLFYEIFCGFFLLMKNKRQLGINGKSEFYFKRKMRYSDR